MTHSARRARAYPSDYKGSGYDRGHFCPHASIDDPARPEAIAESFTLGINAAPQLPGHNREVWSKIESFERGMAKRYGRCEVITGARYGPQHIGAHRVGVPNLWYKVMLCGAGESRRMYAFLTPHEPIADRAAFRYRTTVDTIEARLGIDLFPALDAALQTRLESRKEPL